MQYNSYTSPYPNPSKLARPAIAAALRPKSKKAETLSKLKRAVKTSSEVLATATTVFPFNLFPDVITVDREKLTIAYRQFFGVGEVMSIHIEDILTVTADVGPFFGSLKIATRFYDTKKPYKVTYLWKKDALLIKHILQGYVIALQKKIDCSTLTTDQLRKVLDELGYAESEHAI